MANPMTHFGDGLVSVFMTLIGYAGIQFGGTVTNSALAPLISIGSYITAIVGMGILILSLVGVVYDE